MRKPGSGGGRAFCCKTLASRNAQAKVVAEAELPAKTSALSANRGLSRLASERQPLIFGSARRRRGRGGACRDAGDSSVDEGS